MRRPYSTPAATMLAAACSLVIVIAFFQPSARAQETTTTTTTNDIAALARLPFEQLMEQPVTTVSRRAGTVGASAAAVTVITQEDIRRSGATTIPELLRRVPGMNVARIDASRWAVSIRGFQDRFANKLLVQMDGRTLYNPIFSGVYWDAVDYPLEDIERVEIVRGPGASVWGANAANGIINIITKSADATQGGLASAGGGTEERTFGTVRYGAPISSNAFYRVYAKGFDRVGVGSARFAPVASPAIAINTQRARTHVCKSPNSVP